MKLKYILSLTFVMLFCASCLKDNPAVDFSTVGTVIEILPSNGGGLENFDGATINFPSSHEIDSADIDLNIAARKPLTKTLTITLAVDDALRTAYNTTNGTSFEGMPDSVYSFGTKTGTIEAGKYLDTVRVLFYPSKIDRSKNYMLPIRITDAQGETISGNFGSIYFHTNAQ